MIVVAEWGDINMMKLERCTATSMASSLRTLRFAVALEVKYSANYTHQRKNVYRFCGTCTVVTVWRGQGSYSGVDVAIVTTH